MDAPRAHVPVMAAEVLSLLDAGHRRLLLDLTVGAGGHARALLEAAPPDARLVAADRDPEALALAETTLASFGGRVRLLPGDSASVLATLRAEGLHPDAILLDLGVSSMQLDEPERGFSLREDAPLDMRMDPELPATAADLLNTASEAELTGWLRELGDEPRAGRLARAFVERRARRPFRTTGDLRALVETVLRRRGGRIHPATRTFQALRMAVNEELPLLERTLPLALERLAPGGRLAILAFHSGEDRLVKHAFRRFAAEGLGEVLTPKPLTPGLAEQRRNRRSRSARLRGFVKGGPGA